MAKPTATPSWATDANIASGTETGSPTKVEPAAGYKAQGFVPGLSFITSYFNWFANLVYQWCAYLDNLHNEADFLGEDYDWTGSHTFDAAIDVSANVTVSNAAGDFKYSAARTRLKVFSPEACGIASSSAGSPGWRLSHFTYVFATSLRDRADSGYLYLHLPLPDGAVITEILVVAKPGAARLAGDRLGAILVRRDLSAAGGVLSSVGGTLADVEDDGTTNDQMLAISSSTSPAWANVTVDDSYSYTLLIAAGVDGGTNADLVHSIRVYYQVTDLKH